MEELFKPSNNVYFHFHKSLMTSLLTLISFDMKWFKTTIIFLKTDLAAGERKVGGKRFDCVYKQTDKTKNSADHYLIILLVILANWKEMKSVDYFCKFKCKLQTKNHCRLSCTYQKWCNFREDLKQVVFIPLVFFSLFIPVFIVTVISPYLYGQWQAVNSMKIE